MRGLAAATDLDEVARCLLSDLESRPGVQRVGIALVEGGGRRLRFVTSDRITAEPLTWCHIDAYDDVPLTEVVRTGGTVFQDRTEPGSRYAAFIDGQPDEVSSVTALPLPGAGAPIGGLIMFLDDAWDHDGQHPVLESAAHRTADAVRRVRAGNATANPLDGGEAGPCARLELEDGPQSVSAARRWLRGFLEELLVDDEVAYTAQLCLSELVTNAVVHAGTAFELRATLDQGALTVMVRDRGRSRHAGQEVHVDGDLDPLRVYGRGLQLVDALTERWGSDRDTSGTTVWFVLDIAAKAVEPVG